jgi:chemotaxis protein CheX
VKFLKASGLDDVVILTEDRETAIKTEGVGSTKSSFNERFVSFFSTCAMETLKIQCSFEATAAPPVFRQRTETAMDADIIALIGLTSKAFNGMVTLCVSDKVFLAMMSGMLNETITEINQDIEDGAGELLNIIFGQAKIKLNNEGYGIEKALPTVVRGKKLRIKHLNDNYSVTFSSAAGNFELQLAADRGSSK